MSGSKILNNLMKKVIKDNEESDKGYFLAVDVQCLEKLHEAHHDLSFLPERMKIEKIEKLVANLHDKNHILI